MAKVLRFFTSGRTANLAAALGFFLATSTAFALQTAEEPLAGEAVVIDGDTLDIAGHRVRLEGIDAPETSQTCTTAEGTTWACGRDAQKALARLIKDKTVLCDRSGEDRYGRTLGICFVEGENINAFLVKSGLARAFVKYSQLYVAEEAAARQAHAGVWQGDNTAPWDYRRTRWSGAETAAPAGCAIKGNISARGQVYHVPWSAWYDKVKIDPSQGERWFCDEAEALAAGWRPAGQN